jgi:hypothetical protein
MSKINLIAGQINSGKSNVLRVAQRLRALTAEAPADLDVPRSAPMGHFQVALRLGHLDTATNKGMCVSSTQPAANFRGAQSYLGPMTCQCLRWRFSTVRRRARPANHPELHLCNED